MGVNIPQISVLESNHKRANSDPSFCAPHGQGPTTGQLSPGDPSQDANAQTSCKPQVGPASRPRPAENLGTATSEQVPDCNSYLMPAQPITSEVRSWDKSQNSGLEKSNHKRGNSDSSSQYAPHGQGPTTGQLSHKNLSQEGNAWESYQPEVDPSSGSHSAENFGSSVHTYGRVPEYGLYLVPAPSMTSKVKPRDRIQSTPTSAEFVGAQRGSANRNDDSYTHPLQFPMPSYSSNPQYATQALPVPNKFRKPYSTFPQPQQFQFGAGCQSSYRPVRLSTYPFPMPSLPSPQSICGAHCF